MNADAVMMDTRTTDIWDTFLDNPADVGGSWQVINVTFEWIFYCF